MIDYLKDLLDHTHSLGCIDLVKVTGTETETSVDGVAEDRSVVLQAKFHTPIPEFIGTFGMPKMTTLKTILGLEVYQQDAKISVHADPAKGLDSMLFENAAGDFKNTFRFMVKEYIEEKLKSINFKGATWDVEIEPTVQSIQRLKFQSAANPNEVTFLTKTEDKNLVFYFGDHSSHAGNFVFAYDVAGNLKRPWHWPVGHVMTILNLAGDKVFRISDAGGAMQIIVDSGIAEYTYTLPAQSK